MQVLVVNGFPAGPAPFIDLVIGAVRELGHPVERFDLADNGFDAFMSADERAAYLTDEPLITDEPRRAAAAVQSAAALVICYPVVHGTAPARVKSWQERTFVLGLAFRFTPSGRITGALDHLHRTLVVGVADPADGNPPQIRRAGRRNGFGPCLARSFVLSSNRVCKARYRTVGPADGAERVQREIAGW